MYWTPLNLTFNIITDMNLHLLSKTLTLPLILCAFAPGVGVSRQLSAVTEGQKLHTGVYRIINDQRQPGVDLHVCVNNNRLCGKTYGSASPTNQDVFVLHDKGDNKYIIQSLYNGQYVQDVTKNYVEYETGGSAAQFTILYQDKSKGTGISISTFLIRAMAPMTIGAGIWMAAGM